MIFIKNEKLINKMSSEERNAYLKKLEQRREVIYDELVKVKPKQPCMVFPKYGYAKECEEKNFVKKFKRESLKNELHDVSNAIWHIRYLNRMEKFAQIEQRYNNERQA